MVKNKSTDKLIELLEKREASHRKRIGTAKKQGDELQVEYFKGHVHEIESLLFMLKEVF